MTAWRSTLVKVGLLSLFMSSALVLTSEAPPSTASSVPPTTVVIVPSNNLTLSGTQYFDATASAGTTQVQFELTGSGWVNHVIATATPTIYGWLAAIDTTAIYNGTYTLTSVATSGGQVVTSPGISVTFTNPGPAISIVLPPGGTSIAGTQTFDAVTGPGVSGVLFSFPGYGSGSTIYLAATPTIYGWLVNWDTTFVPNGTYNVLATAEAIKGNNGFSTPLSITVNNPAPTTNVVFPTNGSTVSGQFYMGASTSTPGVTLVDFLFSGGPDNWTPRVLNGTLRTIYGWLSDLNTTFVPGGMPNGTYTLQSEACCTGNVCGLSAPIAISVSN